MSLSTLLVVLSLATAGALVATTRTRWGRRRPLHRYAALSVAAHFLLLAGLASVRTGGPPQSGGEDAPPMRVEIVMHAPPTAEPLPDEPAEPVEPAVAEEPPLAASEPASREPVEPIAAPPLPVPAPTVEASEPKPVAEAVANVPVESAASTAEPWSALPGFAAAPLEPVVSSAREHREVSPVEPTPEAVVEAVEEPLAAPTDPSPYARRGELQQRRIATDEGGSAETLEAVAAASDWLVRAQRHDGAWDALRWGAGRETRTLGHDRRGAGGRAETGLTGLALLALGGAGHTHLDGPYRQTVVKGLQYLLDQQADDGDLAGDDASLYARTYCHSMATFALAEAMAVTGDERLRAGVERAVGYLARSQSEVTGGWRYKPGDRGDMSQMGWAVMALRSAELAGVDVPETVWRRCEKFVDSVARGHHGGLACYQPGERVSRTMTAEAMYCRQILGVAGVRPAAEAEAVASLMSAVPDRRAAVGGRANLYYWYYATLALHHHRALGGEAEQAWATWKAGLERAILPAQVAEGPNRGSWGPDTRWAGYGGRVYATALSAMCLEVDYRYDATKIGRDPWLVAREGAPLYR